MQVHAYNLHCWEFEEEDRRELKTSLDYIVRSWLLKT